MSTELQPTGAELLPLRTVAGPSRPDEHNQPGVAEPAGPDQPRRWARTQGGSAR